MPNDKKPAIQNIPLRTVTGRELYQQFTADRVACEVDFSELEVRVMSQLQDEVVTEEVFVTADCKASKHADCTCYVCGCPCHD